MSGAFDAYHAWLGIPPEEQPPNCYRLLGLRVFEDQAEVIEHAADQRRAHLESISAGKHAARAQRLLNEVAAARLRLLDPYKKAMYDEQLRQELAARPVGPAVPDAGKHAGPAVPDGGKAPAGAIPAALARTVTWAPLGQLGEYQLLEKLGEGGMGAVYKAMHTKLGRLVALKLLPADRLRDEQAIARFEREMKAVGAVDHPNIVRAMDAREVEGTRFLVMEYVEGVNLNVLGRECHPLPVADACEIVRQAALGLEDVHRHGLVHRDVKPSNLMVTPQGVVKLLDLGLARCQFDPELGDEVTGTGMAMGTVDYMAPEQIADSRSVDIRADIYSLGCTLYKLLSGRTPFSGPKYKTAGQKMAAHLRDPVPPIGQFRAEVPPEVVRLVERMLAKDPAGRFSRPAEVADAIGPLAATSDLAALVGRARPEASAAEPEQALVATQEMASSSSWTRFLRQIVGPAEGTAARRPPGAARRKLPMRLAAGLAAAAGVLAAVVLGAVFLRGGSDNAVLVFDWPEAERRGVELVIDGETVGLPDSGPLEFSCIQGEHTISATRPGYRLSEQRIAVQPGQRRKVAANWLPLPNLKLQWPRGDREGAILEIDDKVQEIEAIAARSGLGTLQLRLAPGEHALRITRLGFEPLERRFEIVEGKEAVIRPEWQSVAQASPPAGAGKMAVGPAVPDGGKAVPDADKQPVPPKPAVADKQPAPPAPTVPDKAAVAAKPMPIEEDPAEQRRRGLAARWAEAAGPAEKLMAAWDFAGAGKALEAVRFEEPELAARLAARRDEVARMAVLKARIIARINAAKPHLKKSELGIRGLGGEILEADESGITAKLISGKTESLAWSDVGEKAVPKVLQLAVDAEKAKDWLAAGLMALASGNPLLAERCFDKARSLGANIDPYLVPLAEASFARVEERLTEKDFDAAEAALGSLESKYAALPWLAANQGRIGAAREAARAGIRETEAEKLYAEAAALLAQKESFDLKPIVDRLKADYAATRPVTDAHRKPPFAELQQAVANLGKRLSVRLDGTGDFKSIQAAIDAAPANSLIEIQDNGPYNEKIAVATDGLTLRGKRGLWPVITSVGPMTNFPILVNVTASRTSLERLVLFHGGGAGEPNLCVQYAGGATLSLRSCIAYGNSGRDLSVDGPGVLIENCMIGYVIARHPYIARSSMCTGQVSMGSKLENVVWTGVIQDNSRCELRSCTILGHAIVADRSVLVDCIMPSVQCDAGNTRIEHCGVHGNPPFVDRAKAGKGCFGGDPQFVDPQNLDYRLRPTSPCRGRASDGGDVGCRYTPEMIELCKVALELRRKGILKF